nr:spry domain protein [uncultured Mediterranean phage uvMED]
MVFQNDILAGSSGGSSASSVYQIDQSIRFNDDDSAYMTRTPASAGTEETWTYSLWVKRGDIDTNSTLLEVHQDVNNRFIMYLRSSAQSHNLDIVWRTSGTSRVLRTTQSLRDPSAWYHFVLTADTNNSVASERLRLYINGLRVTDFSQNDVASYISSGQSLFVNKTVLHTIGRYSAGSGNEMDGYLAEIVFIDGTALDPTSFGEETSDGIWKPIDVSGLSFGTNGFHLKGETASDLGNDSSSNNNDFTTSGLAAHDQVADSPTNNFAVTNAVNSHSNVTLSEGNLKEVNSGTAIAYGSSSTILLTSGKWYVEWRLNTSVSNEYPVVGLYSTNKGRGAMSTSYNFPGLNYPGSGYNDIGFGANNGDRFEDNTTTSSWGNAYANGNIAALAIDMDNKKIWFGHNNSGSFVWQASGDPAAGSNEANTKAFASDVVVGVGHYSSSSVTFNYGQDGTFGGTETAQGNADGNGVGNFYYAPPTNYLALCTKNIGS